MEPFADDTPLDSLWLSCDNILRTPLPAPFLPAGVLLALVAAELELELPELKSAKPRGEARRALPAASAADTGRAKCGGGGSGTPAVPELVGLPGNTAAPGDDGLRMWSSGSQRGP